tara:strand:+ start:20944 stop:21258 length:315 start_codon:yes stop_codon:yes gene_type:complete
MSDAKLRKQKERELAKQRGETTVSVKLSQLHSERLEWVASVRGYDKAEYIALLIHRDAESLESTLDDLGKCSYCGNELPKGCAAKWKGHGECFKTIKQRELLSL